MSSDSLPPYLTIAPDEALNALGPGLGTAGFAEIADACTRGRSDLVSRGAGEAGRKSLRLFSTWEITKYLIPVATPHFRRVLKANPDLPQGQVSETEGGAKWFTLDEVLRLRAISAPGGQAQGARNTCPTGPKGLPAKIVAVANFKGGVGKTSTAAHLAMSAALDGYKVLVVDLDSQGSMTSIFGGQVADEWQTVFPLLARHYASTCRPKTSARLATAASAPALDDTLTEALKLAHRRSDPIHPLAQYRPDRRAAEPLLGRVPDPGLAHALRGWKLWDALSEVLAEDGVLDQYDVIFLDTPPALGYLTINGLSAADILLVPLGASFLEFDSTGRFL